MLPLAIKPPSGSSQVGQMACKHQYKKAKSAGYGREQGSTANNCCRGLCRMLPLQHSRRGLGRTNAPQPGQHINRFNICVGAVPSANKGSRGGSGSASSGGRHASKKISKPPVRENQLNSKSKGTQQVAKSPKPASPAQQNPSRGASTAEAPGTCWRLFQLVVTPYLEDPGKVLSITISASQERQDMSSLCARTEA